MQICSTFSFLFLFFPGNCKDGFVKPAGSLLSLTRMHFCFCPYRSESELKCYNKDYFFVSVCVRQACSEHSSFQSIFLPVIHLHTVIKQPKFCLRGTAVSSSCRRLRQGAEACRGPGCSAGPAHSLHLPFGLLTGQQGCG